MGIFDGDYRIKPSSELAGVSGLLSAFADRRMKQQQLAADREFREREFVAQQDNIRLDNARQDRLATGTIDNYTRLAQAEKDKVALAARTRAEGGLDEIGTAIAQDPTGYQAQQKARKFGATIGPFKPQLETVPEVPASPAPVNTTPWAPPPLGPHVNDIEEQGMVPDLDAPRYNYDPTTNFALDRARTAVEDRQGSLERDAAARVADQGRFAGEQQRFQDLTAQRQAVQADNQSRLTNAQGVLQVDIPGGDPFFASAEKATQARLAANKQAGEVFAAGHPPQAMDTDFKQEALRRVMQAYASGQMDLNKPDSGERLFNTIEENLRGEAARKANTQMLATNRGENLKLAKERADLSAQTAARAMVQQTLGNLGFKADVQAYKALNSILTAAKAKPNSALDVTIAGRFAMFAQGNKGVLTDSDVERFWLKIGDVFGRNWSRVHEALTGTMGEGLRQTVVEALGVLMRDTQSHMDNAQATLEARFDDPAYQSIARFKDAELAIFPKYREAQEQKKKDEAFYNDVAEGHARMDEIERGRGIGKKPSPVPDPAPGGPDSAPGDQRLPGDGLVKPGKPRPFGSKAPTGNAPAGKVLDTAPVKARKFKAELTTEEWMAMTPAQRDAWLAEYERRAVAK